MKMGSSITQNHEKGVLERSKFGTRGLLELKIMKIGSL
jgi:hypothetical protein